MTDRFDEMAREFFDSVRGTPEGNAPGHLAQLFRDTDRAAWNAALEAVEDEIHTRAGPQAVRRTRNLKLPEAEA